MCLIVFAAVPSGWMRPLGWSWAGGGLSPGLGAFPMDCAEVFGVVWGGEDAQGTSCPPARSTIHALPTPAHLS